MKRMLYNQLVEWKNDLNRKPLILEGARQVGKTWLIKEFGRNEFSNMVYVNCADEPFAKLLFQRDLKPDRILMEIAINTNQRIVAGKTLVVFDEIQESPNGISALKYFCEDAREQHVIVAGSLLGVVHHPGESYPVGKVDVLRLHPMSFEEFLWASGHDQLADALANCEWDMLEGVKTKLEDLLRQYYFVGGMPEVVLNWCSKQDIFSIRRLQKRIIDSYANDISKHSGAESERIRMVWNSIPSQLAKENKKFIYGAVRKGGRAKDFEVAIQWLVDAGLVHKIYRCKSPDMPLKFYVDFDSFKLYILDVGLLGALSGATPAQMMINNDVFKEFKGAFAENYVLQQLMLNEETVVGYYSKENSRVEIDFLVQTNSRVIPIEVKAEENVKSKSLRQFVTIDNADKGLKGLRCSMLPYKDQGWMENIPLYSIKAFIDKENEIQI